MNFAASQPKSAHCGILSKGVSEIARILALAGRQSNGKKDVKLYENNISKNVNMIVYLFGFDLLCWVGLGAIWRYRTLFKCCDFDICLTFDFLCRNVCRELPIAFLSQ